MTGVVLAIIRFLIILLIVRIVVRFFASASRRPATTRRPQTPERVGGTLVRDPQCGTYLPESHAIGAHGLFFCSTTCRDKWVSARARGA